MYPLALDRYYQKKRGYVAAFANEVSQKPIQRALLNDQVASGEGQQ